MRCTKRGQLAIKADNATTFTKKVDPLGINVLKYKR